MFFNYDLRYKDKDCLLQKRYATCLEFYSYSKNYYVKTISILTPVESTDWALNVCMGIGEADTDTDLPLGELSTTFSIALFCLGVLIRRRKRSTENIVVTQYVV